MPRCLTYIHLGFYELKKSICANLSPTNLLFYWQVIALFHIAEQCHDAQQPFCAGGKFWGHYDLEGACPQGKMASKDDQQKTECAHQVILKIFSKKECGG